MCKRASRLWLAVALCVVLAAAPRPAIAAGAHARWAMSSPRATLQATLRIQRARVTLDVTRRGRTALRAELNPAPLVARGGPARASRRMVAESFATPSGKRRQHTVLARELRVTVPGGRRIVLRVADDGVAFRQVGVAAEHTAWVAPARAQAWLQRLRPNYEAAYQPVAMHAAPAARYGFPALLSAPGGTWALLTESGVGYGDAGSHVRVVGDRRRRLQMARPPGEPVPRATAWRVAVVGSLADIVESDLPQALGHASRIADVSWVRPGRAAWSWWSDSASPRSLKRQKQFVDWAARMGWEYSLVDAGWDPAWVPELVAYARERGVRILLWTDWADLAAPAHRAAALDTWARWGVSGIKVDFLHSDSAATLKVMDDIAADAAERRLVVGFHGSTVPRSMQRTWPNVLTMEAVYGAEHAKSALPVDPAHDVTLAFTRNVIGAMDYTPVAFSAPNRAASLGHLLAQAVVFESGLQHFADSPESYAALPDAWPVLSDVPVAWDDVRLVGGHPGRDVTLARRAGDVWWVGALLAGPARTLAVPLRFLARGRVYRARVTTDGGASGLTSWERSVTRADVLLLPAAEHGGVVLRLTPDEGAP